MALTVQSVLKLQSKKELYSMAAEMKLRGRSSKTKDELAKLLAETVCNKQALYSFLMAMDEETVQLFENCILNSVLLCTEKQQLKAKNFQRQGYGYITENSTLTILDEVKNLFSESDWIRFRNEYDDILWIRKCLKYCIDIQGIIPDDILTQIYNKRTGCKKLSMKEFVELFTKHEKLIQGCCYNSGIFLSPEMEYVQIMELLRRQKGCKYYIPGKTEIEDYYKNGFLLENTSYQRLYNFLLNKMKHSEASAKTVLKNLWKVNQEGLGIFHEISQLVQMNDFDSVGDAVTFIRYTLDTYNYTRMQRYRGHSPAEINRMHWNSNGNTPVFGRKDEMNLITELIPVLKRKGFDIGMIKEMEACDYEKKQGYIIKKKIYPNDKCPCGSGLKFKICCGR